LPSLDKPSALALRAVWLFSSSKMFRDVFPLGITAATIRGSPLHDPTDAPVDSPLGWWEDACLMKLAGMLVLELNKERRE